MLKRIFLGVIRFYQKAISPLLPARCRYYPTCSEYGRQALIWHGTKMGLMLTIRRVLSCHPWGGHGVDFVPVPMYVYRYHSSDAALMLGFGVYVGAHDYASRLNWLMKAGRCDGVSC